MKYLPGDIIQEAEEAIRSGIPLGTVARRLNVDPEDLRTALNIPVPKDKPIRGHVESGVDLWRCDDFDDRL